MAVPAMPQFFHEGRDSSEAEEVETQIQRSVCGDFAMHQIRANRDARLLLYKIDVLLHCVNAVQWDTMLQYVHNFEASLKTQLHDAFHGFQTYKSNGALPLVLHRDISPSWKNLGNWNLMVLLHLSSNEFAEERWIVNRKTAGDFMEAVLAYIHFEKDAWEQYDEQLILLSELSRLIDEIPRDTAVHGNFLVMTRLKL